MTVTVEKILLLKQMPCFSKVADNALAELMSYAEEKIFKSKEIIIDAEHGLNKWYIILEGSVNIEGKNKNVTSVQSFETFGEECVFSHNSSITARASGKTTCLSIDGDVLYRLFVLHPSLFYMFLEMLSEKKS